MTYTGKRSVDILVSLLGILATSPVLTVLAVIVRMDSSGPSFYTDTRLGRDRKPFRLLKLRTMRVPDGSGTHPRDRITKSGRFMRRTSLDELPQLVNVLMGDMSVVGPRPLGEPQVEHMPSGFEGRFAVRPGLTGLAQVSGRNNIPRVQRWALDVKYAETVSPALDLTILWRTIWIVLSGSGSAYPDKQIQSRV